MKLFLRSALLLCIISNTGPAVAQKLSKGEISNLQETAESKQVNDTARILALGRLIDVTKDKAKAREYTDRFYGLVKTIPDARGLGEYFNKTAIDTYLEGRFKEAIPIARTAVKIHKKFGDPKDYMASISGLSNFLITEEYFTESVEICSRTLQEYKDYPDCNEKNALYLWRGITYLELKKYRNALVDLKTALPYYRKVKHDSGEISCYQQIAKCYLAMNDLQSASEYNEKILHHPGFQPLFGVNKTLFLDQSGFIYFKRKMYSKSLASLKKALAVCPEKHEFLVNQIKSNTALCLFFMGREKEGMKMAKEVIRYGPGLDDFRKRDAYYVLGLYEFKNKEYEAAKKALETTVKVAKEIDKKGLGNAHNLDVLFDSKKKLSLIALNRNDPEQSYALLEESYEAEQKKIAQTKDLELHKEVNTFELGEKKREVSNLTKEQLKNRLEIREQQNKLLVLAAGIILALFAAGFTYRGYLVKKRNAKQLENKGKIIEEQNTALQESLLERDLLLKEVHHRVKNNFQMIISLLRMQASEGVAGNVEEFLEEATSRILSMSLIHQNLYQSEHLSAVDFGEYVGELASYVRNAFDMQDTLVFELDLPKVTFDIQVALPLGLVLNEMMLNTVKHVYGTVAIVKIAISLRDAGQGMYRLSYTDNGNAVAESTGQDSFGTELIVLLVQQLGGRLEQQRNPGLHYAITFSSMP